MAARKLQAEIDRTLKKVAEGVELFQSIYDKMQASTNQTQKEKLETDLKTQIKKLQRLRDQIKSWVASSDIKDKTILLENRKLIETQMERFKACEKEMKTKAFSKEGLTAALKLDPKAQEKNDTIAWLQSMVDDIGMQVETAEAEIETLQGGVKKKGKGGGTAERLEDLEHVNERRKWHIGRLELILRLLENGSLSTDKVLGVKEDVQYFVESNTEEDFDEDEGIYDELNLEDVEGQFGVAGDDGQSEDESEDVAEDLPSRTPLKDTLRKSSHEDSHISKKEEISSPVLKKSVASRRKSTTDSTRPSVTTGATQHTTPAIVKPSTVPMSRVPAQLPPMRYSAAAAGTTATNSTTQSISAPVVTNVSGNLATGQNGSTTQSTARPSPPPEPMADPIIPNPPSPSLTHPSISATSPVLSSISTSGLHAPSQASRATPPPESMSFDSQDNSPLLSEAAPAATSSPHRTLGQGDALARQEQQQSPIGSPRGTSPPSGGRAGLQSNQHTQVEPSSNGHQPSLSTVPLASGSQLTPLTRKLTPKPYDIPHLYDGQTVKENDPSLRPLSRSDVIPPPEIKREAAAPQALPSALSDLLVSFEGAKQKAATRMSDLNHVHKILEAGYHNIPQPRDTSKPKYYVPKYPYQTPSYYPQTPHAVLSTPSVFSQIDVETLFYVFYYLPGTYQQYLAAKELKKQSWRFHVKYLTWFQRHSEPQAITEEYEQGVYVYFDWEGSWCQRKKSDFRFEYRYLSED